MSFLHYELLIQAHHKTSFFTETFTPIYWPELANGFSGLAGRLARLIADKFIERCTLIRCA